MDGYDAGEEQAGGGKSHDGGFGTEISHTGPDGHDLVQKLQRILGVARRLRFVSWTRFDQVDQMVYLMGF